MFRALILPCVAAALCAAAPASSPLPSQPELDAGQWIAEFWPLLTKVERAQCPLTTNVEAEKRCILGVFEREADGSLEPYQEP